MRVKLVALVVLAMAESSAGAGAGAGGPGCVLRAPASGHTLRDLHPAARPPYVPFAGPLARRPATCFGYDHSFEGKRLAAYDRTTLEPVPGKFMCPRHSTELWRERQVRAYTDVGASGNLRAP